MRKNLNKRLISIESSDETGMEDLVELFRVIGLKYGIPMHSFDLELDKDRSCLKLYTKPYSASIAELGSIPIYLLVRTAKDVLGVSNTLIYQDGRLVWDLPAVLLETSLTNPGSISPSTSRQSDSN